MNTSTRLRQLADRMGLDGFAEELREIAGELEAPSEPFGYFRAEPMGWTDCAADDEGAIALYEAPPDVETLRKELAGANDFIKSLADVCQKYEELLGYRKTNAPEGASELAEAKGESSVNTELGLASDKSTCQHDFALDPKSSIRICLKCGTPERRAIKPTPAAPSQDHVTDGFPWEAFPVWLLEHHEGETITKECLTYALGKMFFALGKKSGGA